MIPNDISLEKMREVFHSNINNDANILLVAKIDGKLVGTLLAITAQMYFGQCKSLMVVEDFIVEEQYRGTGIGTALMKSNKNQVIA